MDTVEVTMTGITITDDMKSSLQEFFADNPNPELVSTYLFFVGRQFDVHPVLFPKEKTIYLRKTGLIDSLEQRGELYHETEIIVSFGEEAVNEATKRVYICPFSGKVFGDNTHPNPQDAIYDWVSKCPENTERVDGLRVKRFFVSEDPEVIKNYIGKDKPKEPLRKTVFSSVITGRLFNSKEGVIKDLIENQIKELTLEEVQAQNRFELHQDLLNFFQEHFTEEKITQFVEAVATYPEFNSVVEQWVEE